MMKRILNDGISIINDKIVIDFDHDAETDILNILQPEIYKSEFLGNIYYFGYIFKDNASRHDRTIILKWLKNLDNNGIDKRLKVVHQVGSLLFPVCKILVRGNLAEYERCFHALMSFTLAKI